MSHGPEHHMEHAEHAVHAAGDAFNRQVTMSIAIVAAVLACVTMLGHRAHNETLRLQGEALRLQAEALRFQGEALQLQTLASRESTNAANKWSYYQSKNLIHVQSKITLDLLAVLASNEKTQKDLERVRALHQKNVEKFDKKLPEIEAEGHAIEKKSDDLMVKSNEKIAESQKKMHESQKEMDESHLVHEKGNRFDLGELGLQFGVVLCSLAILMKSRGFWFAGLVSAALGAVVAMSGQFGLFMGHH
jgi:Domain of unknown function (DUF4337)